MYIQIDDLGGISLDPQPNKNWMTSEFFLECHQVSDFMDFLGRPESNIKPYEIALAILGQKKGGLWYIAEIDGELPPSWWALDANTVANIHATIQEKGPQT